MIPTLELDVQSCQFAICIVRGTDTDTGVMWPFSHEPDMTILIGNESEVIVLSKF